MRLAHRLLAYTVAVVATVTTVVVLLIGASVRRRAERDAVTRLTREARLAAVAWRPGGPPAEFAVRLATALREPVVLYASDGRVLAASGGPADTVAGPEVTAALMHGSGWARRRPSGSGAPMLYVAARGGGGVVRVAARDDGPGALLDPTRREVTLATVALLTALGAAIAVAHGISAPIVRLRDVARALAQHDYRRAVPTGAPGEVAGLATALQQLGAQLEALETTRRDFVANVSHELRTPLTVVGGFAETLVADTDAPAATRQQFAGAILTNTRRMQRIVDDLLDLSRIESGGWVPRPQLADVRSVIQDAIGTVQEGAHRSGVVIGESVAADAETVFADRTALRQIVVNLVQNAVRHTPAGGHVTVFAESARHRTGIWVGVRDDGEGIAAEHLPRIFERFYRVDSARSRNEGGTGLGLAIVRHLAEAHGGAVQAESTPGAGTTIRVFFPAARDLPA